MPLPVILAGAAELVSWQAVRTGAMAAGRWVLSTATSLGVQEGIAGGLDKAADWVDEKTADPQTRAEATGINHGEAARAGLAAGVVTALRWGSKLVGGKKALLEDTASYVAMDAGLTAASEVAGSVAASAQAGESKQAVVEGVSATVAASALAAKSMGSPRSAFSTLAEAAHGSKLDLGFKGLVFTGMAADTAEVTDAVETDKLKAAAALPAAPDAVDMSFLRGPAASGEAPRPSESAKARLAPGGT